MCEVSCANCMCSLEKSVKNLSENEKTWLPPFYKHYCSLITLKSDTKFAYISLSSLNRFHFTLSLLLLISLSPLSFSPDPFSRSGWGHSVTLAPIMASHRLYSNLEVLCDYDAALLAAVAGVNSLRPCIHRLFPCGMWLCSLWTRHTNNEPLFCSGVQPLTSTHG